MSRINSRQAAVDKINKIFGLNIGVQFYDEDPMIKEVIDNVDGNEDDFGDGDEDEMG